LEDLFSVSLEAKKKEHMAKAKQLRKRLLNPYLLTVNMAPTGAIAVVKVGVKTK